MRAIRGCMGALSDGRGAAAGNALRVLSIERPPPNSLRTRTAGSVGQARPAYLHPNHSAASIFLVKQRLGHGQRPPTAIHSVLDPPIRPPRSGLSRARRSQAVPRSPARRYAGNARGSGGVLARFGRATEARTPCGIERICVHPRRMSRVCVCTCAVRRTLQKLPPVSACFGAQMKCEAAQVTQRRGHRRPVRTHA